MPAPVGLGTEGYAFGIGFREGLHTGGIDGEGESAIANAEGGERIDFVDVDAVTLHEGFAVDGLGVHAGGEE